MSRTPQHPTAPSHGAVPVPGPSGRSVSGSGATKPGGTRHGTPERAATPGFGGAGHEPEHDRPRHQTGGKLPTNPFTPNTGLRRQQNGHWTDLAGTAHIREAGTGLTFCGAKVDPAVDTRAVTGCDACVAESITDYARHHDCGEGCRVNEYETTGAGLDRRVPQASEAAQLDRRLSWSGRIIPLSEPCRDLELMERVHNRLHHL